MADARWATLAEYRDEILADLDLAVQIWDGRTATGNDTLSRIQDKALQKSLQDAYSSFEQAALYVLTLAAEIRPTGARWHEHLATMVCHPSDRRPALAPDLGTPLRELRQFRHLAMHGYSDFDMPRAAPAIAAARQLLRDLPAAFGAFGREFGLLSG